MRGWVGVDLDGTLAIYNGWNDGKIGKPIQVMVDKVKKWLKDGIDVRIITARVARTGVRNEYLQIDDDKFADEQEILIKKWCKEYLGQELPVTATKDFAMVEMYDDRCKQVIPNDGRTLMEFFNIHDIDIKEISESSPYK